MGDEAGDAASSQAGRPLEKWEAGKGAGCKAEPSAGGQGAGRPGGRRPRARGEPAAGVLGAARVYLKVSVLVEAGEAVRHFAAFTPPQDDALRFAPSLPRHPPPPCFHASSHAHRARAAAGCGGRGLGGREQECVPTGIPEAQALWGPGGGTFAQRPASRTAPSDPRGPRMRTSSRAPEALPEGKISGAGCAGFGQRPLCCSLLVVSSLSPALVHVQAQAVFAK